MPLIQPFPSGCGNMPRPLRRCASCEGRNHSLRRTPCIHWHLAATHRTGQVLTGPRINTYPGDGHVRSCFHSFRRKNAFQHPEAEARRRHERRRAGAGRDVQRGKNTYGGERGGFIAGQVFKFTGFVSGEGSLNARKPGEDHVVIVTYWHSFEAHEKSHADATFKSRFSALMELCTEADEIGYEMLWQGEPEP